MNLPSVLGRESTVNLPLEIQGGALAPPHTTTLSFSEPSRYYGQHSLRQYISGICGMPHIDVWQYVAPAAYSASLCGTTLKERRNTNGIIMRTVLASRRVEI